MFPTSLTSPLASLKLVWWEKESPSSCRWDMSDDLCERLCASPDFGKPNALEIHKRAALKRAQITSKFFTSDSCLRPRWQLWWKMVPTFFHISVPTKSRFSSCTRCCRGRLARFLFRTSQHKIRPGEELKWNHFRNTIYSSLGFCLAISSQDHQTALNSIPSVASPTSPCVKKKNDFNQRWIDLHEWFVRIGDPLSAPS